VDARELQPDGTYILPASAATEPAFAAQKFFMAMASVKATAPVLTPAPAPERER
jgi:hypothetical protein